MEMKHSLNLQLRPALIMTPRLQQALKLLQVPTLELQQILKQEIMQNPLLEEVDELTDNDDLAKEESADEKNNEEAEEPSEEDPIDWSDYLQDGLDRTYIPASEQSTEFLEKVPVTRTTLAESLLEQLHFLNLTPPHLALAEFLVGSLDDRGFLVTALEDVAAATGQSIEECEKVLRLVQALEPVGVGARDLRECLLIQLDARRERGSLSWRIIDEHFDHLVNRRFPEIARQLKVTVEEVQEAADVVATLNPRPGLEVSSEDPKYVVPDLLVERVDDEYVVVLNDRHLPRLRISSAYESVLREKKKNPDQRNGEKETRDYIQGKLNSARWLIQTIEQRRRTMIKVMNCIIREQREFFDRGIAFLRPLTLQQVARQIDMHESTVSRVCSGKYVQCPRGVFELKFFFSSGLETEDGEDVSARTAKDIIKRLIEEEDRKAPHSDDGIARILHERGLKIARRTVAKYREQLKILPARFRKRVA
jgi:RNA polymerase sigma-54 factor